VHFGNIYLIRVGWVLSTPVCLNENSIIQDV